MPQGARVGTSSLRRQCQLSYVRPDLQLHTLRGNVDTRLRKLDEGEYDAIILAAAGLVRLGLERRIADYIDVERSVPAVGQGVIGIECRADDARSISLVQALNDADAWHCCETERAFAQRLQGSCQSPIAGFARLRDGDIRLDGVVGLPDGTKVFRDTISGPVAQGPALGLALAERLLTAGAQQLLDELRDRPQ